MFAFTHESKVIFLVLLLCFDFGIFVVCDFILFLFSHRADVDPLDAVLLFS